MLTDQTLAQQFDYVGYKKILPHVVCLKEDAIVKEDQIVTNVFSAVNDIIKQKKLPVLNLSVNPIYIEKYIDKLNQYIDPTQYLILSANCLPDTQTNKNVVHWPSALLMQQMSNQNYLPTFKKIYRISCLMRNVRLHRLLLLNTIKNLATQTDVIVANASPDGNIPKEVYQSTKARAWMLDLPWASQQEFFDLHLYGSNKRDVYTDVQHPGYRACVNITAESWAKNDMVFISEKTWKAYACACLVVNYGSADVPMQLEKYGLSTWKEFDSCIDYESKVLAIKELFLRNDIQELYKKNLDMIMHNQQMVVGKSFAQKMSANAIEKLQNFL